MPDERDQNSTPQDDPTSPDNGEIVTYDHGVIIDQQIERELHVNYLTYAMSTIVDRALPDIRDGLKPSQRRILVAMHDLNLRPGRKHLKCAKIAGDTSGNYHPHGESVIYPTLVNMAQKWRMRVPLIDPQGNFGSIEGDPPAAMRYTEARMTHASVDMLDDIKLDTVDYQANYDDRLQEPMILPARFPNLLINGGVGIAVGMATSLPPNNPTEIFDAIIALVANPDMELIDLLEIVKGPDFPTGGVIVGRRGILDGYATGRGKVYVRGKVHTEEFGNGREQLVIDEIPYNLVQSTLVERIVTAIKEERIKDVTDVRNESGRAAQTRVVLELRRGADAAVIENQLYQFTPLQQTFSIMNIALVNRQPRTLSLKEMLQLYIDHRFDVITRRTQHLLREALKKAHILEGLIYAVCDIDEVIRVIRSSQTREEAINRLAARRYRIPKDHPHRSLIPSRMVDRIVETDNGELMTRVQAEAIGAMRLIQLVGLEIEKLVNDYAKLVAEIEDYESILADRNRVLAIITEDCEQMKARFGSDRLTEIQESEVDIDIEALIKEEEMAVTISHEGYIKRVALDTYRKQGRGGRGIVASGAKDEDFIEHVLVCSTHADLLCFTNTGRVFKIKVYEAPVMSRQSRGRSLVNILDLKEGEKCVAFMPITDFEKGENFLAFATAGGLIKRSSLRLYQNVNKSGLIAVRLNEGDTLVGVTWTSGHDHLLLETETGMSIRFRETDARPMGRSAAGVKGIDLRKGDEVVALVKIAMHPPDEDENQEPIDPERDLLTLTEHGYGKRTLLTEYLVQSETESGVVHRPQSRGGKGRIDIRTEGRNGKVVGAMSISADEDIILITQGGMLVRTKAGEISRIGRATQGVRAINLKSDDRLIAAARVEGEDEPEEGEGEVVDGAASEATGDAPSE